MKMLEQDKNTLSLTGYPPPPSLRVAGFARPQRVLLVEHNSSTERRSGRESRMGGRGPAEREGSMMEYIFQPPASLVEPEPGHRGVRRGETHTRKQMETARCIHILRMQTIQPPHVCSAVSWPAIYGMWVSVSQKAILPPPVPHTRTHACVRPPFQRERGSF